MKVKVSDYIAQFFVDKGITHNFTVTGGGAMHLNDAFGHHPQIQCIYNHNEQGSAIAAEAYARVAKKIAVCCVTTGPGGTNAITGVVGGWLDSIPMFVVSGQVKRETTIWSVPELGLRQLGDQEFDIINSVKNMTKYAAMVTDENEIAYHLEKAFHLCNNGRFGPVWLDIPLDIQGAMIETDNLKHYDVQDFSETVEAVSDETAIAVLEKIKNAKAPLVITGTGITCADAYSELYQLLEKLGIPAVTSWSANDTVPFENPSFAGMPGTLGTRGGNFCVQNCDLLISLGCRLNVRTVSYNKFGFAPDAFKIMVDIDEKELKKPTIIPDMPIHADVKDFINALLKQDYTKPEYHATWLKWAKDVNAKYPVLREEFYGKDEKINPYVFIDSLFDKLSAEDIVACGNGSACVMTFQVAKLKQGQRMFANSGCASMGYGMPAALGAAIAAPDKRIVCLDGDGSFMMNMQEMQAISHNNANVKLFLINNSGYLSIRQTQNNLFKPPLVGVSKENGVSFPDFQKIAEAFGVKYYSFSSESDLSVIDEALLADGPVICEVIVDEKQNFEPKLSAKVMPDGKITSPPIDDMFPFLSKEEYEAVKYR